MRLHSLGTTEDVEQLTLFDTCRGQEGAPVQAQPNGAIGAAFVDDLVGIIAAEIHVDRAAFHAVEQLLPHFDVSSVL